MKIAVFTSNQPRHQSLLRGLASVADEVFAVQEVNTVFPGEVPDFFAKSPIMQDYFGRVLGAERKVFGELGFLPKNVRTLSIKMGDLNRVAVERLRPAVESDLIVVFGSSYIKSPLIDALLARRAVNIHMGISPQFRGSSCNFWAIRDGRADLVGATVHLLGKGLDSGDMLFHALPEAGAYDPFDLGMYAVRAAHEGLIRRIRDGSLATMPAIAQDRKREIRYSKNAEFTDDVAGRYLENLPAPSAIRAQLERRELADLLEPHLLPHPESYE